MIKRALISVHDKTGIVEFAEELIKFNIEIISTGGTYRLLKKNNIKVISVEEVTGFPEMLNGRVKTLHPDIFAGILSDRNNEVHSEDLCQHNIIPIDLVAVNLYPFEEAVSAGDTSVEDAIEEIDIGGVSLMRAAAKNFKDVNIISDIDQYEDFIKLLTSTRNSIPYEYSRKLAMKAFEITSSYDNVIYKYFSGLNRKDEN